MTVIDRRRKKWIGWIPAILLSIVIVVVIVVTAVLMAGGLGQPTGEPAAGEATERGASVFTDDGLRYINETREIKLDLRGAPVEAAALGLPEEGTLTVGPHPGSFSTEIPYTVMLRTPAGLTEIEVLETTITTADGEIAEVRSQVRNLMPFRMALDLLNQRAEEFGYTVDTDRINTEMAEAVRAEEEYAFTVGPGSALGATTTVDVSCEHPSACAVVFRITPGVG